MNVILAPIEPDLVGWECTQGRDTSGHSGDISKKNFESNREWDVKMLSHSLAGSEWNVSNPLIPRILVTWHPRVASGVYLVVFVNTEGESLAR